MGLETDSILKISGKIIQITYYSGMLPFKWDWKTGHLVGFRNRWESLRFHFTIAFMLLLKGAIPIKFAQNYFSGLVNLNTTKGSFEITMSIIFGFMILLDLHLLLKTNELQSTFNHFSSYYKFIRKYLHKESGKHWSSFVLGGCIGMLTLVTGIGLPLLFALECHAHLLAGLMPNVVCDSMPDGTLKHGSIIWAVGMGLLQAFFGIMAVESAFFILTLSMPISTLGWDFTKEFRTRRTHFTKPILREWREWTVNYQALQILMSEINYSVGYPVLGPILAFVMTLHVLILTTVLVNGHMVSVAAHSVMICVQAVCLCVYFCVLNNLSLFSQNLRLGLGEKKRSARTKHRIALLKSFRPVEVAVGYFARINRMSTFTVINIVVNQTVDLVIGIRS